MNKKSSMDNIKYIMVTNWKGHWDNFYSPIPNAQSTLFTHGAIKHSSLVSGPWLNKAKTLFIKLDKSNKFEKAWTGISANFRPDEFNGKPAIRFEVYNLSEVQCPEAFKTLGNGWHLNSTNISGIQPLFSPQQNKDLQPAFFQSMISCSWEVFEQNCLYLLRLLGIHDIHALPRQSQHGKADGFFKFYSLTVIYDATLETNFITVKEQQIENYINQLKKEKIHFNKQSYTIKDTHRQVWVITRGEEVRHLKTEDHIKVKEVPYKKLIDIYHRRLNEEIGTDELCDILKDIK